VCAVLREDGKAKFTHSVVIRDKHQLRADEHGTLAGATDSAPSPFDFLCAGLGACESMTVRIYAERKNIRIGRIATKVSHEKVPATSAPSSVTSLAGNTDYHGLYDHFTVEMQLTGDSNEGTSHSISEEERIDLLRVSNLCPVHKLLGGNPRTFFTMKLDTVKSLTLA